MSDSLLRKQECQSCGKSSAFRTKFCFINPGAHANTTLHDLRSQLEHLAKVEDGNRPGFVGFEIMSSLGLQREGCFGLFDGIGQERLQVKLLDVRPVIIASNIDEVVRQRAKRPSISLFQSQRCRSDAPLAGTQFILGSAIQ